jgi:hypothetical protein
MVITLIIAKILRFLPDGISAKWLQSQFATYPYLE